MKWERSSCSLTATPLAGLSKLGQPEPESNLAVEANSGSPQHTQLKVPDRFSRLSGEVPAGSVPCWRVTWYCSGVSSRRHSASVLATLSAAAGDCLVMDKGLALLRAVLGTAGHPIMTGGEAGFE